MLNNYVQETSRLIGFEFYCGEKGGIIFKVKILGKFYSNKQIIHIIHIFISSYPYQIVFKANNHARIILNL